MAHFAAASVSVRHIALGTACIAVGVYSLDHEEPTSKPARITSQHAEAPTVIAHRMPTRAPILDITPVEAPAMSFDDDVIRGYEMSDDPAEFEYVFEVDGVSYLRLDSEARASSHGTPRLFTDEDGSAVVAAVDTAAMPIALRPWAGREVMVGGECRARVVGFAEVSRVTGDPPDHEYDYESENPVRPEWTLDAVRESNITLAARLDAECGAGWARATSYPAAASAKLVEAPDLVAAARRELLAPAADDKHQLSWVEQGGEGNWRDAIELETSVYEHALTDERWVFVQAQRGGGCGEPSVGMMVVYRASGDGNVRRVAELEDGISEIQEVIDLDGDGQPELIVGDGNSSSLMDLAGEYHTSIAVASYDHTCGC
ncbi:MAG: hypothetical protein H0T89_07745 [Deltaproteobacteria bacterium]|nr:hypothetical protein [Deltaproteobacteria bacterium]